MTCQLGRAGRGSLRDKSPTFSDTPLFFFWLGCCQLAFQPLLVIHLHLVLVLSGEKDKRPSSCHPSRGETRHRGAMCHQCKMTAGNWKRRLWGLPSLETASNFIFQALWRWFLSCFIHALPSLHHSLKPSLYLNRSIFAEDEKRAESSILQQNGVRHEHWVRNKETWGLVLALPPVYRVTLVGSLASVPPFLTCALSRLDEHAMIWGSVFGQSVTEESVTSEGTQWWGAHPPSDTHTAWEEATTWRGRGRQTSPSSSGQRW